MKNITFNKKVYWVTQPLRCKSGRIVGLYPDISECIVITDGDTKEIKLRPCDLFETKEQAINAELTEIEKKAKRITEEAQNSGSFYQEEARRLEYEIRQLEMASNFLKSQLDTEN